MFLLFFKNPDVNEDDVTHVEIKTKQNTHTHTHTHTNLPTPPTPAVVCLGIRKSQTQTRVGVELRVVLSQYILNRCNNNDNNEIIIIILYNTCVGKTTSPAPFTRYPLYRTDVSFSTHYSVFSISHLSFITKRLLLATIEI